MESQPESTPFSEWARSVEPWVLPVLAAVVVAGVLLLCTLIGMFWLASQRTQQPIVIWMQPIATQAAQLAPFSANDTNLAVEGRAHARAN